MRLSAWTRDALNRIAWTAAQVGGGVLIEYLLAGEVTWRAAFFAAGLAAVKAAVKAGPASIDTVDAAERVVWTFAQAAGALLVVQLETGEVIAWKAILAAGALAAGKVLVARRVGDPETAALLPR